MSASVMSNTAQLPPEKTAEDQTSAQENIPYEHPNKSEQLFITPAPTWLPLSLEPAWQWFKRSLKLMRHETIKALPAPIVNNSSNIIAGLHVGAEMFMFKSGQANGKLVDDPSRWQNWFIQPVKKISSDIFTNSSSKDYSFFDLFRGNPIKNFHHYIFDTHDATLREASRLKAAGKPIKFGNPWQARTTGSGILVWILGTVIPEKKQPDQEIERMATLSAQSPLSYVGERLKQAVWFPEWNSHKPQMIGLGYLGVGTFSTLGSWRNRGNLDPQNAKDAILLKQGLKQGYRFNWGYLSTAIVSYLGGLALLFSLDERSSYGNYGAISPLRIPAIYVSCKQKYKGNEPGWESYTAGKLSFQVVDFLFSLFGGAEKRKKPDGSYEIIDHDELKIRAIKQAKQEGSTQKERSEEYKKTHSMHSEETYTPLTTVAVNDAVLISAEKFQKRAGQS